MFFPTVKILKKKNKENPRYQYGNRLNLHLLVKAIRAYLQNCTLACREELFLTEIGRI